MMMLNTSHFLYYVVHALTFYCFLFCFCQMDGWGESINKNTLLVVYLHYINIVMQIIV